MKAYGSGFMQSAELSCLLSKTSFPDLVEVWQQKDHINF